MILARQIKEIPHNKNSVITVGTFDGVHLAHQKIIKEVVAQARKRNGRSVVLTFDPHPREVVAPAGSAVQLLTTLRERQELCEHLGVDWFVMLTFDKTFANQSFREFYLTYLINGIGMSMVVEGYDHHWGKNREGTIASLLQLGREFAFEVENVEPFTHNGIPVNSSMLRTELNEGNVETAAELLGRPYALRGTVVPGDRRGRALGYPTANIELDSQKKLVPRNGIYFVTVDIGKDHFYGMASIGVRPTFHSTGTRTIEVNILDFNADIYGFEIQIGLLRRLRDELKFNTPEELIQQMHKDREVSMMLQDEYKNSIKQVLHD
ncbi:MAG: bifunctional riboflavin kinase/FAD synthetase [Ignavibacteriae bacterium]|nr:MAG: bifunctional riboflavin kinase/FAD synthetase [Ignavibacteriota bacterium]